MYIVLDWVTRLILGVGFLLSIHILGVVFEPYVQLNPGSIVQVAEHPSPL